MGHEREDEILRDRHIVCVCAPCLVMFFKPCTHARAHLLNCLLSPVQNVSTCEIQFKFPFSNKEKNINNQIKETGGVCEQERGRVCIESNALTAGLTDV